MYQVQIPTDFDKSIAYKNFERGLRKKAPATKENYRWAIKSYMKWHGATSPADLLAGDNVAIEDKIMSYVDHAVQQEKLASGSIRMKLSALRLFYDMNRRPLSWGLIEKTIEETNPKKDRAYTKEEIKKVLSVCDIRTKAIILLLISSGVRLGALPRLLVGSLKAVDEHNIYLVRVYEDTPDFYYTFCTPETRTAIDQYLELRTKAGENVTSESPLFRLEYDSQNKAQVADVKPVNEGAIKKTIQRITNVAGIRNRISLNRKYSSETCSLAGKTRHEVKQVHGFRKFFNTTCKNAGMDQECKEFLMGHDCGLDENYYDDENPESVKKMIMEYMKAADKLTISEEKQLKEQVEKLRVENAEIDVMKKSYLDMKLTLERKDVETDEKIAVVKRDMSDTVAKLIVTMSVLAENAKDPNEVKVLIQQMAGGMDAKVFERVKAGLVNDFATTVGPEKMQRLMVAKKRMSGESHEQQ